MSVYTISARELQDRYEERIKNKVKIYEKILEACYRRIKLCADKGTTFCIFTVPEYKIGVPTYSMVYCAAFIIKHLKLNNYHAEFYNPNVILIKWSYDEPDYFANCAITTPAITWSNKSDEISVRIADEIPQQNRRQMQRGGQIQKPRQTFRPITDNKPLIFY